MGKHGQRIKALSKIRVFSGDLVSPVSHLLGTNYTPTEEEASLIKETLTVAYKREKNLLNKLAIRHPTRNPFPAVSRMQTKRKLRVVQDYIFDHLAIISSFRRLPVEILQIIFEYWQYTPNPIENYWNINVFSEEGPNPYLPWRLSHVCRFWRNIILSSPKLWGYLSYIYPSLNRPVKGPYFDCLSEILERSRGSTVDFDLFFSDNMHSEGPGPHPLLTLLMNHCERWNDIKISGPSHVSGSELAPIRGRLSSLKKLSFKIGYYADKGEAIDLFSSANNLEELDISNFKGALLLPSIKLRTLKCSTSWPGFTNVVPGSGGLTFSHLTHLTLAINSSSRISPGTTFPKLIDMQLTFHPSSDLSIHNLFLNNVVVPSLENLSIISSDRWKRPDVTKALWRMLRRSGMPSLYFLSLDIAHKFPGSLSSLLSLTVSLKHLKTSLPHHKDIQSLASVDDMLVPFLETCRFEVDTAMGEVLSQARLALQTLGKNRCKQSIPLGSATHPGNGKRSYAHLCDLHLNFKDGLTAARHQCIFQGWGGTTVSRELEAANARLLKIFPEILEKGRDPFYLLHLNCWRSNAIEAHEILNNIHNLEIFHGSDIAVRYPWFLH